MASLSPAPELPVRFTMIRTLRRSIAGRTSGGGAAISMASPCETPAVLFARRGTCGCTSMTGNFARGTDDSFTCSMLRGSNSVSGSEADGDGLLADWNGAAAALEEMTVPADTRPSCAIHSRRLDWLMAQQDSAPAKS